MTKTEDLQFRESLSLEADLRAWVSSRLARRPYLTPEAIVEKLRKVADSWSMVNLQVKVFDGDKPA